LKESIEEESEGTEPKSSSTDNPEDSETEDPSDDLKTS